MFNEIIFGETSGGQARLGRRINYHREKCGYNDGRRLMTVCPTKNATLRMIAASLRRSFIAAKRVAMTADSGDGDAMARWVAAASRECRRCGESEALQDNQASDNRRDDNARR